MKGMWRVMKPREPLPTGDQDTLAQWSDDHAEDERDEETESD